MNFEIQQIGTLEWRSGASKAGSSLGIFAPLALIFVCAGVLIWLFWPKPKPIAAPVSPPLPPSDGMIYLT